MSCPYCALRASDSDDHIFPQFLGGRATIPACNQCNSTFGHTIEASAFEHFKHWMFVFRRSGMAPPRPMIWRKVAIDDSGRRYDLDILRPKLGHLVYVRSSQEDARTFSILQFFGFIQLYCDIPGASSEDSFSILATHDPISHSEDFREIPSIDYAMPPQFGSAEDWGSGTNAQIEKMRLELVDLYGDQAPQSLSINHP